MRIRVRMLLKNSRLRRGKTMCVCLPPSSSLIFFCWRMRVLAWIYDYVVIGAQWWDETFTCAERSWTSAQKCSFSPCMSPPLFFWLKSRRVWLSFLSHRGSYRKQRRRPSMLIDGFRSTWISRTRSNKRLWWRSDRPYKKLEILLRKSSLPSRLSNSLSTNGASWLRSYWALSTIRQRQTFELRLFRRLDLSVKWSCVLCALCNFFFFLFLFIFISETRVVESALERNSDGCYPWCEKRRAFVWSSTHGYPCSLQFTGIHSWEFRTRGEPSSFWCRWHDC